MAQVFRRGKSIPKLLRRNTETGNYLAQMAETGRSTNLMCPPLRGTLALSRRRPSLPTPDEAAPMGDTSAPLSKGPMVKAALRNRHAMIPGIVDLSAHSWKLSRQLHLDFHEVKYALETLQSSEWSLSNGGMERAAFKSCLLRIFDRKDIPDAVLQAAYQDCGVGEGPVEPRRFVAWYRDHLFSLGIDESSRLTLDLAKKHHCSCIDLDRVKSKFDHFDSDKSGVIEYPEFERMIFSLLHCSKNDLPEGRMHRFWNELDKDGSGDIDFEEFTEWYLKYFALAQVNGPIEAFYASFLPDVQRSSNLEAAHIAAAEKEANERPPTPTRQATPSRKVSHGGSKSLSSLRRRATIS